MYSNSVLVTTPTWLIIIILLIGMMGAYYLGYYLGNKFRIAHPNAKGRNVGPLESSLLGLLALLLAFTFNMSANRFDMRIQCIINESNCISTAILRSNLYPDSIKYKFRSDFKEYLEARIDYFESGIDTIKRKEALVKAGIISTKIWNRASKLSHDPIYLAQTNQMIPALNAMIDIVNTRDALSTSYVPTSIIWLLFALCLLTSFVISYDRKGRKITQVVLLGFFIMVGLSIYLIIDLDRPRTGIINLTNAHQRIVELRKMF